MPQTPPSTLNLRMQPGERVFALQGKNRLHFFGFRRPADKADTGGDFEACELFDLGGKWLMSDYFPVGRDYYQDLVDTDEARVILELAPDVPDTRSADVYPLGSAWRARAPVAPLAPKSSSSFPHGDIAGWLYRISTNGRTFDVFLMNSRKQLAVFQISSTGRFIPARRVDFIKKLKLPIPLKANNNVLEPVCPSCNAPGPHVSNDAAGSELRLRCSTCTEEFEPEEPKARPAKRARRAKKGA